ncbi:malto-oligosyltrehalose trehalohydrolase [Promicromonospora thailandica]|uniref:Malto-oligosyltrehalose trehalohydrolase n=1 Tax=Promicromonospora thailandica TaxID=765201 RepID=A0A9X2JWE0_9MICO|nr:malto-oligosyltrehalose trehalohydrolase [Promicromonospora thailandica]MCP2266041.1 maltooligosyl trehalose hydrolase (EC 3.2.1.141) [Promicromonospora thailandica]BFF21362.1 malto-oligosyltrehalose trehalohydrolase [Promicromonospora thailandica]
MTAPLRVWAPRAARVDLVLPGPSAPGRELMVADGGGWWRSAGSVAPGTDYAFALDGGPPRPDPRSPWQPAGVHGPSRTFDVLAHAWADGAWAGRDVRGAVVYELHVGTFTPEGTLDAAVGRLGHLQALGVDMVELMPLAAFGGRHGWGYDGVALWAVHDPYGGPAALQRFVDAAHAHGIAVCLDVVDNHLGPSGNYLGEFGPYFTDRHQTPWGAAVNLDGEGSAEVRAFVVEKALRWFRDFHVDALRLDAVHALVDDSPRHLLAELSDAVAALAAELGRPLSLVAESDANDPRTVTPTASSVDGRPGLGMTAQWADDVHHALHALVTGERQGYYVDFGAPETLATALTGVFVHDGGWSTFRERPWGAPVPPETDGRRFVVCSQNHDQVGNRALGDRPSRVLAPGALAVSAAVVLLGPCTPMLFMGEEWGATTPFLYFSDHEEPELAQAVSRGRAAEFGGHGWADLYGADVEVPDPQAPSTVEASRLDWSEVESEGGRRMLELYRALVGLRRSSAAVASGDRTATTVRVADGALVMTRGAVDAGGAVDGGGRVDVVLVPGEGTVSVPVPASASRVVLDSGVVLGGDPARLDRTVSGAMVTLRGPGVVVLA